MGGTRCARCGRSNGYAAIPTSGQAPDLPCMCSTLPPETRVEVFLRVVGNAAAKCRHVVLNLSTAGYDSFSAAELLEFLPHVDRFVCLKVGGDNGAMPTSELVASLRALPPGSAFAVHELLLLTRSATDAEFADLICVLDALCPQLASVLVSCTKLGELSAAAIGSLMQRVRCASIAGQVPLEPPSPRWLRRRRLSRCRCCAN